MERESLRVRRRHKNIASDMLFLGFLFIAIGMAIIFFFQDIISKLFGIIITLGGIAWFIWGLSTKDNTEKTVYQEGLRREEEKKRWKKEFENRNR